MQTFSLGAVAAQMGVKTPSLYYHFSDKWELLSEVARLILEEVQAEREEDEDWESQVVRLCIETRRSLLRYPQAAQLMLEFFPRYLRLNAYDAMIGQYPFAPTLHMLVTEGTEKLTFGSALMEAAAVARNLPLMPTFDVALYPNLARAIAANALDDEAVFEETVRIFIEGIKVRAATI